MKICIVFAVVLLVAIAPQSKGAAPCSLTINSNVSHQTMEGFGATTISLVHFGPLGDTLAPELRKGAIDALYAQVKLNTGNLEFNFVKSQNAGDSASFKGYSTFGADAMKSKLLDLATPLGFTDYLLCPNIHLDHNHNPALAALRDSDREKFLAEAADQVVMAAVYFRDRYHISPRYIMPFNEPTSGNKEIAEDATNDAVDLIAAIGQRLRAEGLNDLKMVVPCEETVARSVAVSQAILADDRTRPFVGAIGYHCYPYGSAYASVPRILKHSGKGNPEPKEIAVRNQLRDLGEKYHVPLWMMEVSHSEVNALSFDAVRGRAIHIHDELLYADASAYYGMFNMWDLTSHREHFKGRGGDAPGALYSEKDNIILIDNEKNKIDITGIGYAIGHFSRWIHRGAVRLESNSSDPLVQASVFRDRSSDTLQRFVIVAINNAPDPRELNVQVQGVLLKGETTGEESTESVRWRSIDRIRLSQQNTFSITLPALSVTSLAVPISTHAP